MRRASSKAIGLIAILAFWPANAPAQLWGRVCGGGWIGGGAGSTPIGDIERGRGFELAGLGMYNLDTAIANRLNVESSILLNEYIYSSILQDNQRKSEHKMAKLHEKIERYNKILERIRNDPDLHDLDTGAALNVLRDELLHATSSSLRLALVVLPGEAIRQIPFQYAQEGVTFSMERLMARDAWPLALREEQFQRERMMYDRALDETLVLASQRMTTVAAVDRMRTAVKDLQDSLDRDGRLARRELYIPAKTHLKTLADTAHLFTIHLVEEALGDIEKYHGTTVRELLEFMNRHKLRFSAAESPVERDLYRHLFASLIQQKVLLEQTPPRS
jgi:hypothetical protein